MKTLTLYLTGICLMCFFTDVKAQSLYLGVRGGLSIPNLTAGSGNQNPLNTGYSSRLGPDAGIFAEYKISELFSVETMLQYSSQGGKKNGFQAFTTPTEMVVMFQPDQAPAYLYADYKSEAKMNYLMLPILVKFGWNISRTPLRLYVGAGPFASYLINASQVTSGQSQFFMDAAGQQPLPGGAQSFDATTDIKDQLHRFNVGIEGNLGFSYRIGVGNIFIEGGGNYGLLNIQKNAVDGKNNTGAATIDVGYSFLFGK